MSVRDIQALLTSPLSKFGAFLHFLNKTLPTHFTKIRIPVVSPNRFVNLLQVKFKLTSE
jgi:hypothetical protein